MPLALTSYMTQDEFMFVWSLSFAMQVVRHSEADEWETLGDALRGGAFRLWKKGFEFEALDYDDQNDRWRILQVDAVGPRPEVVARLLASPGLPLLALQTAVGQAESLSSRMELGEELEMLREVAGGLANGTAPEDLLFLEDGWH